MAFVRTFESLDEVKALIANGGLDDSIAHSVVEFATTVAGLSEIYSDEQAIAIEILARASQQKSGATALTSSLQSIRAMMWAASEAPSGCGPQLMAVTGLANLAGTSSVARTNLVQAGATESLLRVARNTALENCNQPMALLALYHLSCEPSNLEPLMLVGTIEFSVSILAQAAASAGSALTSDGGGEAQVCND